MALADWTVCFLVFSSCWGTGGVAPKREGETSAPSTSCHWRRGACVYMYLQQQQHAHATTVSQHESGRYAAYPRGPRSTQQRGRPPPGTSPLGRFELLER
ncbi:hypothetical protein ACJQWK_08591 [Exserohilum turcicum]